MPIDSSIVLGLKPTEINSPMQTMGQVMALREMQRRDQANQITVDKAKFDLDQLKKDKEEDDELQAEMAKSVNTETGAPDLLKVQRALLAKGRFAPAAKVQDQITKAQLAHAKDQSDLLKEQGLQIKSVNGVFRNVLNGAKIMDPATGKVTGYDMEKGSRLWAAALPVLSTHLTPDVMKSIPTEFDPDVIEAHASVGNTIAESIDLAKQGLEEIKLAAEVGKTRQEIAEHQNNAVASVMASVLPNDKAGWDSALKYAKDLYHVDPAILKPYEGGQTKEAVTFARNTAMSLKDRLDLAENARRTQVMVDAEARLSKDAKGTSPEALAKRKMEADKWRAEQLLKLHQEARTTGSSPTSYNVKEMGPDDILKEEKLIEESYRAMLGQPITPPPAGDPSTIPNIGRGNALPPMVPGMSGSPRAGGPTLGGAMVPGAPNIPPPAGGPMSLPPGAINLPQNGPAPSPQQIPNFNMGNPPAPTPLGGAMAPPPAGPPPMAPVPSGTMGNAMAPPPQMSAPRGQGMPLPGAVPPAAAVVPPPVTAPKVSSLPSSLADNPLVKAVQAIGITEPSAMTQFMLDARTDKVKQRALVKQMLDDLGYEPNDKNIALFLASPKNRKTLGLK